MSRKGLLIVVSGFSGAGKGTVMKRLTEKYEVYALSISATTRSPRQGEEHGKEYFFKTVREFEELISGNKLIEYARYVNNYYGTPSEYVETQLESGRNVILEIEIQGALKIKEKFPNSVLIFLMPPNAKELEHRLIGRGTETQEVIHKRLLRAAEESQGIEQYDYIVINDILEDCVDSIHSIIQSEYSKAANNSDFINNIREELRAFSEGETI